MNINNEKLRDYFNSGVFEQAIDLDLKRRIE